VSIVNADEIQAAAEREAKLIDPERSMFRRNLDWIVEAVNADAQLSPAGIAITNGELTAALSNRLQTLQWTLLHPEISAEVIQPPLFLTGLPRSGTTFFQHLFDNDPALRLLRVWESARPCPPPAIDAASVVERQVKAREDATAIREAIKGFDAMHLYDPDGPDECHALLTQTFAQAGFYNYLDVPDYFDRLLNDIDLDATFRVHRRQLQLLQWKSAPRRWTLKYPNHLLSMDAIVRVYPGAQFVITHRDPVQTLASLCNLTDKFRAWRSDIRDPQKVGRQMRYFVRQHILKLMQFEKTKAADINTIHVDYYRLVDAPAVVLGEVYDRLGLSMPQRVRESVVEWHRRNPKGKRGKHSYNLEQFGLAVGEVTEEYSDYIRMFDIPTESVGLARGSAFNSSGAAS
jgi:hypothetical protein